MVMNLGYHYIKNKSNYQISDQRKGFVPMLKILQTYEHFYIPTENKICRNKYSFSKNFLLSAVFTPHQGNFFLQLVGTSIENHSQSKCCIVEPSSTRYVYKTCPHPSPSEHGRKKEQGNCKS